MIGKLIGVVETIYHQDGSILLNVCGVCYTLYCSMQTLSQLQQTGTNVALFIETLMNENNITLYGFLEEQEKLCFKYLKSVQGVGGKVAIMILSVISVQDIVNAIHSGNHVIFQQVSGIGNKISMRITTELKNNKGLHSLITTQEPYTNHNVKCHISNKVVQDAISAITKLGFNGTNVTNTVNQIYQQNQDIRLEDLLRKTIANLANQ